MINPFSCVNPSARADAANLLHFDHPHRPLCSSPVLAIKAVTAISLRLAANIFHLVFHIALLSIPLWIVLTIVPPIVNWAKQYRERMETRGEGDEEGFAPWSIHLWNIWSELMSVASDQGDQGIRSLSPTPVPDFSEQLEELYPVIAKLDEKRERFEPIIFDLGVRVYDLPQYQDYRRERAIVNKALLTIRRAQTPPGERLPGSLKRENAVTRSAFLNGDTRPREECFDSDEETAVGDEYY